MLPAYRVEVLEYEEWDRAPCLKPHIVFEDSGYEPLANLLNWRFPSAELLRDTLTFLERPWHDLVQNRQLQSEWATLTITRVGDVRIESLDLDNFSERTGEILVLSEQELIAAFKQAIAIAEQLDVAE